MNTDLMGNSLRCLFALFLWGVLPWLVLSQGHKMFSGKPDKWVKPRARTIPGDKEHVYIDGNTEEIFRLGIPGGGTMTHIGYKKWRVDINNTIANAEDVAAMINNWDGSSQ